MTETVTSLDNDLAAKAAAKYDLAREVQAREWIEEVSGVSFDPALSFAENLKNGVVLCKTINAIMPQSPVKFSESKLPFKQMENIHMFLEKMKELGVPSFESFQTVDLFEAKNIGQVVASIFALSRHAEKSGFQGPRLGPKLVDKVERRFTAEQLAQSKAAVPLLQGFQAPVSQSGMGAMGGVRQVFNPNIGTGDTAVQSKIFAIAETSRGSLGVSIGKQREIGGKYLDKQSSEEPSGEGDDYATGSLIDEFAAGDAGEVVYDDNDYSAQQITAGVSKLHVDAAHARIEE
ncbi:calponin [Polyrhizophydium stewartii]|uniref:Calponin n=1 Tax=Polyrhizophydium stewartii TaxID=2732419 RepID=A0ABR4MYS7_9FUNG